ncbi:MAG: hypothetical protein DWQ04_30095 [Chloroflexi bacterium]|nr:MAG: hypothetical protein DWQ04_30095 [Chloroflexota bacterium]
MAKANSSRKQIIDIAIIILIILCVGLIVTEMVGNVSSELAFQNRETTTIQLPTPYPTLTTEELRESLSQPTN